MRQFIPAPAVTFVKPDLLRHLAALERLGLQFEIRRLGNDVFNELGWLDPSGHLIRLVEARTFSPSKRLATDTSLCGYFLEIALPTASRDEAKDFWERFGFVGIEEPDAPLPHVSCTSDSVDIGLYEPAHLRRPRCYSRPAMSRALWRDWPTSEYCPRVKCRCRCVNVRPRC